MPEGGPALRAFPTGMFFPWVLSLARRFFLLDWRIILTFAEVKGYHVMSSKSSNGLRPATAVRPGQLK